MNQEKVDKLYSRKQQEVLRYYFNNDFKIMINHGAIRSGKTHLDNDIFLHEIMRISDHAKKNGIMNPLYILAGADLGALARNVFNPLMEKRGIEFKLNRFNIFKVFDVNICCFGHDDIGKLNSITGMTSYGAYINEAVRAKDAVLKQIIKRCSADPDIRGRIIMDTNPDGPQHPIKVDYIDKVGKKGGEGIAAFHWQIWDNLNFLGQQYIDDTVAVTPSGVFTDRDIHGLWVTPEGVVYRDFNANVHVIDKLPTRSDGELDFNYFFAGVDWGYEHKGSICFFGVTADGITYMISENSRQYKLIDYWIAEAKKLIEEYGKGIPFYCDPARPDHIRAFKDAGIWAIPADNSILSGVETVAKMYKSNTLYIYKHGMTEFLNEIYAYVWNPVTGLPVQVVNNTSIDDAMCAMRYGIHTHMRRNGGKKCYLI